MFSLAAAALAAAIINASATECRSSTTPRLSRRSLESGVIALNAQLSGDSTEGAKPSAPVPIAVIDFDYQDTSGEPQDQSAKHRALMGEFMSKLRGDLVAGAKFAPVTIACADPPCTAGNTPPAALIEAAKAAGARLMIYGEVHKMSTLVQWGKMETVDLKADRLIDDKMLTFRGDTEEAWLRAEAFLAEELRGLDIGE